MRAAYTRLVLLFTLCAVIDVQSSQTQTRFSVPFHAKNSFVYRYMSTGEVRIASYQHPLDGRAMTDTFRLVQTPGLFPDYSQITRSADDRIVLFNRDAEWEEFYPASPPITDSLYLRRISNQSLDSSLCVVTRRFDTSIFNTRVKAFTCFVPDKREMMIADTFGLVRYISFKGWYDSVALSSCMIDGEHYNWDQRETNWMSLCVGNSYLFRNHNTTPQYRSFAITKDTVIDSRRYFYHTLEGWLREDQNGLYRIGYEGQEELFIPANASVGTIVIYRGLYWFVTNCDTYLFAGKDRKHLALRRFPRIDSDENVMTWTEEMGLTFAGWSARPTGMELVHANVCGYQWGTPVAVSRDIVYNNGFDLSQNFPNPFSHSTAISYKLAAHSHVKLEVHDLFGRKITTLVDEEKNAGEHTATFDLHRSTFDIHPGLYLLRLTTPTGSIARMMTLVR